MHLLQAGVNLIYIRDFLGHENIKTTEIYAKCDSELKRQAIENAYPDLVDSDLPDWNKDAALLDWLSSLSSRDIMQSKLSEGAGNLPALAIYFA